MIKEPAIGNGKSRSVMGRHLPDDSSLITLHNAKRSAARFIMLVVAVLSETETNWMRRQSAATSADDKAK